jgi:hypothetical protein
MTARTITIDLNSPDYRSALVAMDWSLHTAKKLGYVVPTGFEIALRLMKGELQVPLFSDLGGTFGIITDGTCDPDDLEEIFALYVSGVRRRREAKRAEQQAVASGMEAADDQAGGQT